MRIFGIFAIIAFSGCKKEQPKTPVAVENYSRIFEHPVFENSVKIDEQLGADFNIEMAKVDQVFKTEMKSWGLDAARMGVALEKGAKIMIAEFPELTDQVWAAAAAWTKVFELTVGGEGIATVAIAVLDALGTMRELISAASPSGDQVRVKNHVREIAGILRGVAFENPNTKKVVNAIGRQVISGVDQLIASHPKYADGLKELRSGIEQLLAA